MTVSVSPKSLARHAPLGGDALGQLFTKARTHGAFLDRPVPDALLREALELAKMAPTAANNQPLRILFLRSNSAKERLRPAMAPGNVDKTMAAPVVAVAGYDVEFYEHLPFLTPQRDLHREQKRKSEHSSTVRHPGVLQQGLLCVLIGRLERNLRTEG